MIQALNRILSLLILTFLIFAATRALVRALPGDPIETLVAESGTSLSSAELRKEFHLDQPYWRALEFDLKRAVHGDLGISMVSHQPVAPLLGRRLLKTAELTFVSMSITILLSISLGVMAAVPHSGVGRIADPICSIYGAIASAMPTPWSGPLLMIIFCIWIPIFPLGDSVALPAITLALSFTGFWARLVRARVRETLEQGAASAARARGLPEWKVLLKYGLAPCSGSLLAYLGTQIGALMAGAFVTEMIFDWPGMGDLLINSVLRRDYPVVESATFVAAFAALLGNALGDWAQRYADPRLADEK